MLRAKLSYRIKLFFERLKAKKERFKRDAIYSTAGLIAREEKQTLKVRSGVSRPGSVPHAHTRAGLRVILFAVDRNRAIIGPVKFSTSNKFSEPVPSIHEFGKTVFQVRGIFRILHYPERPYAIVTLKRLQRRNKINKQFAAGIARIV